MPRPGRADYFLPDCHAGAASEYRKVCGGMRQKNVNPSRPPASNKCTKQRTPGTSDAGGERGSEMPRILGVDLPNDKPTHVSLRSLYGIGPTTALRLCD